MQRMFNLDKWQRLEEGEVISFENERPRMVLIETNTHEPGGAALWVKYPEAEEPAFLAFVGPGRDTVEFGADGKFDLIVAGGGTHIYTVDGADWSVQPVDDTTYTKIIQHRQRNPELELMMAIQQRNLEARLAAQAEELNRRLEAALAAGNAGTGTGTTGDAATTIVAPAPAASGGESVAPAPEGTGGLSTPAEPATAPAGSGANAGA